MQRPSLTIGIPTFNRAGYLEQAVQSVLDQSFRDFELLIVDNASTDATADVARKLQERDSRVRYVRNETNLGMTGNWARIAELAAAPHLKYLMDDDLLLPGCLERFWDAAQRHPSCTLVACLPRYFSVTVVADGDALRYAPEAPIPGKTMIEYLNQWCNQIGCPTNVMFRTEALAQIRTFWSRSKEIWAPDLKAFVDALDQGDFYCINSPLVAIRVHSQSLSSTTHDRVLQKEEADELLEIARRAGGEPRHYAFAEIHIARAAFLRGAANVTGFHVRSAVHFLAQWIRSPHALRGAAMALSHRCQHFAHSLRRVRASRMGSTTATQTQTTRYRYAAMRTFWAARGYER
ncbi:MAG: glycosyltransferase family 2 protein [Nitrospiraceae bacterium]|nr:glycosyltransferase family 2 protein [Nitrospiraceae bacterium]